MICRVSAILSKLFIHLEVNLHWTGELFSTDKPISHVLLSPCFIERRADLNIADWDGASPLHYAAFQNNLECLRLLRNGAMDNFKEQAPGNRKVEILI